MNNKAFDEFLEHQSSFSFPVKIGDRVKLKRTTRAREAGMASVNRFKGKVVAIYPEYFIVDNGKWKQCFSRGDIIGNIWTVEVMTYGRGDGKPTFCRTHR